MKKVHQNIILNGVDMGDGAVRRFSKFCNEGKWDNFIVPLLPKGEVFMEFGSNAGMYLKMAGERGYKATGYERSKNDCDVAMAYRDSLGLNYGIIQANIDENIRFLTDVVLMANFHYHQELPDFLNLLDRLETQTCYCLVVSISKKEPHWLAQPNQKDVEYYFRHWDLAGQINPIPQKGDPHPREMFSYLFKSRKIRSIPLTEVKLRHPDSKELEYMRKFVKQVLTEKDLNIQNTDHYRMQQKIRGQKWTADRLNKFMEEKKNLINDIAVNGLQSPVVLNQDGFLADGLHRFLTAEYLDYKGIITR